MGDESGFFLFETLIRRGNCRNVEFCHPLKKQLKSFSWHFLTHLPHQFHYSFSYNSVNGFLQLPNTTESNTSRTQCFQLRSLSAPSVLVLSRRMMMKQEARCHDRTACHSVRREIPNPLLFVGCICRKT